MKTQNERPDLSEMPPYRLGRHWSTIQAYLMPSIKDDIGELSEKMKKFVETCELLIDDKMFAKYRWCGNGRPPRWRCWASGFSTRNRPKKLPKRLKPVNKEREIEKGNFPHFPYKEKERGKEIPSPSIAPAQGEPVWKGDGKVGFGQGSWKGKPGLRPYRIDADFILESEHDPVQIALVALNVLKIVVENGRTYNNSRIMP